MRRRTKKWRANRQKTKLGLPDLEHVKSAVLVSLRSPESQRSHRRSIDDFVCWYCSEPRLSFNKTVVTRYRIYLEDRLPTQHLRDHDLRRSCAQVFLSRLHGYMTQEKLNLFQFAS